MSATEYTWFAISLAVLILSPVFINFTANYFDEGLEDQAFNYDQWIIDIKAEIDATFDGFLFFGSAFAAFLNGIIDLVNFLFGWLADPLITAAANFRISIESLESNFGLHPSIIYVALSIFVIIPTLIAVKHLPIGGGS